MTSLGTLPAPECMKLKDPLIQYLNSPILPPHIAQTVNNCMHISKMHWVPLHTKSKLKLYTNLYY